MEPRREETDLATELRALRPTPRPEFAADLDARAAAGFPTSEENVRQSGIAARLAAKIGRAPRWRVPALAGAAATATIAVATAVVAISEDPAITPTAPPARVQPLAERPSVQFADEPAVVERTARGSGDSSVPQSRDAAPSQGTAFNGAGEYATGTASRASGPNAFLTTRRDVERSASIVLATETAEVRAAASRVFEAVHGFDGIVLRSSISAGEKGGAVFDLLIPSGKLGGAMAAFSEIAEVRSRRDATSDVTGLTTGLEERLRDSRARIESLLGELAGAEDEAQRAALERELRFERRTAAGLRASLAAVERRVSLSRVSLRIVGEDGALDDGRWGVADALDDAARILAIAAGVTVIGLAVLAPLALLAAVAWLATRVLARRRRERALD
jgi:hypothetical protein